MLFRSEDDVSFIQKNMPQFALFVNKVLLLDQSVVALGELTLQHSGILRADVVESVLLCRNVDALAELIEACLLIDEGELDENRAIKVVQKVAPVLKDGSFVLVLRKLVVDVLKGDGLRVEAAVYLADTVAAFYVF